MTRTNQDFGSYIEDDDIVSITITDGADNIIDVSSAQEIIWWMYDGKGDAVLTKQKTLGDVTGNSSGVVEIVLAPSDKADLAGWYFHVAEVTDSGGRISTFECGRALMKIRSLGD